MLERIVEFDPAIDMILMTAHDTTETAVEAIQKGASDYLNKPVSIPALRSRVPAGDTHFEGMIGRSPLMWTCLRASAASLRTIAPLSLRGRLELEKISAQPESGGFRSLRHLQLFGGRRDAI